MIIDTSSKEGIYFSLAEYLDITTPELYKYILDAKNKAQDDFLLIMNYLLRKYYQLFQI